MNAKATACTSGAASAKTQNPSSGVISPQAGSGVPLKVGVTAVPHLPARSGYSSSVQNAPV